MHESQGSVVPQLLQSQTSQHACSSGCCYCHILENSAVDDMVSAKLEVGLCLKLVLCNSHRPPNTLMAVATGLHKAQGKPNQEIP